MGIRESLDDFLEDDETTNDQSPSQQHENGQTHHTGDSVLDRFCEAIDWPTLMVDVLGYSEAKAADSQTLLAFKRPGGTYDVSAKVLKANPHVLVVHSTDAGLPTGKGQKLTKARVYAHLRYSGDMSAFSRALLRGDVVGPPPHVIQVCKASSNPFDGICEPNSEQQDAPGGDSEASSGQTAGDAAGQAAQLSPTFVPVLRTYEMVLADELIKMRARDRAREILTSEKLGPLPEFDAGTVAEILARPPQPKARIAQLVPWDASTLITAQRKTGKTTFVGNLCRSLITGYDFLDKFPTRKIDGDVALLNYEMPAAQLAHWMDDIGVPHDRLHIINLRGRRNPLGAEEDRAALAELMRSWGVEVVIYDPFGRAYTGKNQNDPGEVQAWLAELDRFTRGDVGAKDLFLAAHAGWEGERTRGASSLEDWPDSIITLTRAKEEDGGGRYIKAIGRDIDLEEDQLVYDDLKRRLSLAGVGSRKEAAHQRKQQILREAIKPIVAGKPGIIGTAIGKALREDGVSFRNGEEWQALKFLVQEGELRRDEEAPKGYHIA